jgi:hypothetical protein
MIIVDLSQVMISNIMMQLGNHTNSRVEENMVRHMVLNSIRNYRQKFLREYGEMIIACDNKNYWRRKLFPYYKANRKKSQAESELNWKEIFECLNKIKDELKQYFPYRIIDIDTAEADDVIATLVMNYSKEQKVLIISGDKDFIQLHAFQNVVQYDPVRSKFITHSDPIAYRNEHVMRGDPGDGIPNVLSSDNCFVIGERQKPVTQKKLNVLLSGEPMPTDIARNYMRNKQLIDLTMSPKEVSDNMLESYKNQENKKPTDLMNYFMTNRLKNLMQDLQEFV